MWKIFMARGNSWPFTSSAVLGGFAFVVMHFETGGLCLGASGAVTAVMVLYALHYPTRVIYLFMFLPIPIWLFVVFQVAQDLFGFLGGEAGGVAVSVHLAGAAFAFVYYKMHWRVLNFWPDLSALRRQAPGPTCGSTAKRKKHQHPFRLPPRRLPSIRTSSSKPSWMRCWRRSHASARGA